jgi:two-component system sensor histidine kinase TtrS
MGSRRFIGVLAGLAFTIAGAAAAAESPRTVRIGVLAFRGLEHTKQTWTPTADYLSARVPGHDFTIVPLLHQGLRTAAARDELEFVFTNSGHYVELESELGISRIVTLKKQFGTDTPNVFGAVLFTRKDRTDIRAMKDLHGTSFAAVARSAFGGFQMAWREMHAAGIDPFADLSSLIFLGLPQDLVVLAVRDGRADVGTVRTGVLETMAAEGKIDLADYRILHPKKIPGSMLLVSTALYPEWPFAKTRHTPPELAKQVAVALLAMDADSTAMRTAGYAGWTVPLDYQPVHDLFRDLGIGPYVPPDVSFTGFIRQYWEWVVFAAIILLMLVLHSVRTEYLVARRTRELSAANIELEHEIQERQRAEARARRHEAELAHVSRVNTMGEIASGLAHELNQPLSAIGNFARGSLRRLEEGRINAAAFREAMEQVVEQTGRAGQIIRRVRGFLRKHEPRRGRIDLNRAVEEVAGLLDHDARSHGVEIQLRLARPLPPVAGDMIEIEQVILNLAKNAIDAMTEADAPDRRLTIETEAVQQGEAVRLSVSDSGPGITPEVRERLWEPFFTTRANGLGIGLAICRSIVESHDGRITAASEPEGGAVLSFELPRWAEDDEQHEGDGLRH